MVSTENAQNTVWGISDLIEIVDFENSWFGLSVNMTRTFSGF